MQYPPLSQISSDPCCRLVSVGTGISDASSRYFRWSQLPRTPGSKNIFRLKAIVNKKGSQIWDGVEFAQQTATFVSFFAFLSSYIWIPNLTIILEMGREITTVSRFHYQCWIPGRFKVRWGLLLENILLEPLTFKIVLITFHESDHFAGGVFVVDRNWSDARRTRAKQLEVEKRRWNKQCDQIGRFCQVLGDNFFLQKCSNIWWLLRLFWKTLLKDKTSGVIVEQL